MKLDIEYFDSTEELLLNGNSPNVRDLNNLNNLNLLVRADISDTAADTAADGRGAVNNDELLIYQFQRDFFFEKSQELKELEETAEEAATDSEEQQLQPLQPLCELCALHGRGAVILINDNKHTAYVAETDDVANSLASIIGSDEDEDEEADAEQANQASPSNDEEADKEVNEAEEVSSDTGNTVNTVATVGTEDPADPEETEETADNSADTVGTVNAEEPAETANTSDTVGSVSSSDSDGSDGSDGDEAEEAVNDEDMADESYEAPTIYNFYWNTAIIVVTTASTSSADTLTADSATIPDASAAFIAAPTADTASSSSVHITRYLVKKIREISGYLVTHREVYQTYDAMMASLLEESEKQKQEKEQADQTASGRADLLDLTAFFILRNVLQTQAVRVVRGEGQQNSPIPFIPTSLLFIINQAKGVYATARLLSEKRILVLAGSRISKEDSLVHQKGQEASERLRQGLIEAGVIDRQERTFNADYEFHSTSSAASVILGQSANGLTTWKDAAGHKLAELLGRRKD